MSNKTLKEMLSMSPEELIRAVLAGDIAESEVKEYPLDNAREGEFIPLKGTFFGIIKASDASVTVDVEFNKLNSGKTTFSQGLYVQRPFGGIYLTHTAQAGKSVTIVTSMLSDIFKVFDNRTESSQTTYLASLLDHEQGGTAAGTDADDVSVTTVAKVVTGAAGTRGFSIFADKANTDVVYLGFTASTSSTRKIIALSGGDFFSLDNYRGDIYAIAGSGTQKISVALW